MRRYVVLDTNVLVSAMLKWTSVPGNILEFAFNGVVIPVLNKDIVREYREVLLRSKFHLTEDIVSDVIKALEDRGEYIDSEQLEIDYPDPKDAIFYEVVMEKRKSDDAYLVTGNIKHFPAKHFVVTPRELLDIILKTEE